MNTDDNINAVTMQVNSIKTEMLKNNVKIIIYFFKHLYYYLFVTFS